MTAASDLKELERKAYRSYQYQDGLWDMYLGLFLIWGYIVDLTISDLDAGKRYLIMFGMMLVIYFLFVALKKWVSTPRLGVVRFGRERQTSRKKMALFLAFSVIVNVLLVLLTFFGAGSLGLSRLLSQVSVWVWIGTGVWIAAVIVIMGFFMDFARMMAYGVLIGAGLTITLMFNTFLPFAVIGIAIFLVGLVQFIRFLRRYPLPKAEPQ